MRKLAIIGGAALLVIASPVLAGTATGTLEVTMTVANNCTLSSGGGGDVSNRTSGAALVDFGAQVPGINQLPIDGSTSTSAGADIVLNCSAASASPQISFDAGSNAIGNKRRLINTDGVGPAYALYDIYVDSGRVTPLLPNQFYDLTPVPLKNGLEPGDNIIPVYARIEAGQTLVPGFYGDDLTIVVNY